MAEELVIEETIGGIPPKYIGLLLAVSSSFALGSSPILTKLGLMSAAQGGGMATDSYSYLQNKTWWMGLVLMVVGEILNFAAYMFAAPILVAPLGALSVLIGAILAALFLNEKLGKIGMSGCSLCFVGSLVIVMHAPEDKKMETVDEVLKYAVQPGFIFYCCFSFAVCVWMIFGAGPRLGHRNPLVYITVCSLAGSITVMAVKGLGVALKLTLSGNNQMGRPGTYVFAITVVSCILLQLKYLNKALELFPTNVVNPVYYVGFSGSTIVASIILFQGLYDTSFVDAASLICGFFLIGQGVYLLNVSRETEGSHAQAERHSVAMNRMSISNLLNNATEEDDEEEDSRPLVGQNHNGSGGRGRGAASPGRV